MIRILSAFFLLLAGPLLGQEWNTLQIKELQPGYYIFTTYQLFDNVPFPANGLYAVGDSAVIVIDTPWNEAQFQPLLDSIEKRHHKPVVFCMPTHFHDDRTAGLEYYASKGISTWSSRKTYQWCVEKKGPKAEHTFIKDTIFTISGIQFESFYPGPGHAPDNIVVYFPKAKILYGGCFVKSVENEGLGYIGDADLKSWEKGIKKVIKRYPEARWVIPGHFNWSGTDALLHTLDILKNR
ncbi:MAG: Beta-lactamase [Crocinitomicaceae bacterium]|jgi:glyoxylase-like metal-dependent hydrolase (beta-lactamase superfamily II)|nr:Beta-lactamase [Crocinitomicaceae bacterium]